MRHLQVGQAITMLCMLAVWLVQVCQRTWQMLSSSRRRTSDSWTCHGSGLATDACVFKSFLPIMLAAAIVLMVQEF